MKIYKPIILAAMLTIIALLSASAAPAATYITNTTNPPGYQPTFDGTSWTFTAESDAGSLCLQVVTTTSAGDCSIFTDVTSPMTGPDAPPAFRWVIPVSDWLRNVQPPRKVCYRMFDCNLEPILTTPWYSLTTGPLAVTALSLQQSPDKSAWSAVAGDLAGGYTVALDGLPASWPYLDVASLTANRTLADGYYGFALGQAGLPANWLTYWAARGVDASATGWQGQMWQIINGNAPIFFLKVSGGGSYMLVDGLGKALGQPDDFLRVNGDYPLGTYSYSGSVSDTVGGSANVTAQMTFAGPLAVTALSLEQSPDKSAWSAVAGDLAGGYTVALDGLPASWTYLDVASLTANRTLADGSYGFALGQAGLPANWLTYWAAKGVVAGATGWQGQMWQIINGNAPIFFLKVSGGGSGYMLVDGLGKALGQPDDFLRVNGDYPLGAYSYSGSVSDTLGGSASVSAQMTFVGPLAVTALSLQQSPDKSAWTAVTGNLAGGYTVALDGLPASWTYLDVASLTANRTLVDGYYGFALGQAGLPANWLTYWAARGVDASATGWQGQMWQIINGNAPIFYLKVSGGGSSYMLVDGLGKALGQPDDFLRVNGDYPLGTYSYSGSVNDTVGGSAAVTAQMTFVGPLAVTALSLEQSPDKSAWSAVAGDLAGGYTVALDGLPASWTYLDVASLTANRTLADGSYGFALGQAGLPADWLTYWAAQGRGRWRDRLAGPDVADHQRQCADLLPEGEWRRQQLHAGGWAGQGAGAAG